MEKQSGPNEQQDEKARLKRQRDFDDLQNEEAGRETGRIRRFTNAVHNPPPGARDSNYLQFLAMTAALWDRTEKIRNRIIELDRAADKTMRQLEQKARQAQEQLEDYQGRATLNRFGLRVYQTQDGQTAFYENGNQLTAREFDQMKWRQGAPSWEEYYDASKRLEQAADDYDEVKQYREALRRQRDLVEHDEPLSEAELDSLEKDLQAMPESVRKNLEGPGNVQISAAQKYMQDDVLASAPDVAQAFKEVVTAAEENTQTGRTPASRSPKINSTPGVGQ